MDMDLESSRDSTPSASHSHPAHASTPSLRDRLAKEKARAQARFQARAGSSSGGGINGNGEAGSKKTYENGKTGNAGTPEGGSQEPQDEMSRIRALLRPPPIPGVRNWGIPDEPEGVEPDPALVV